MRFNNLLILLVLFAFGLLYAGDRDRVQGPIMIYDNGFVPTGVDYWAGGGAGIADANNAEVLFYNPAWKARTKYTFLLGGVRQFEKRFFLDQNLEVKMGSLWLLPSHLLLARQFNRVTLFLGYQNIYHFKQKFRMQIATVEHPEGTGEFISNTEDQNIQNFFVGVNRQIFSRLSLGAQVGLARFYFSGRMGYGKIISDPAYSYTLNFGLNYEMNDRIQFALAYRYFEPLTYKFKLSAPLINNADSIVYISKESKRPFRLPWFLDFGFHLKPADFLDVMFKVEYQEWQKIASYYPNRLHMAFGASVKAAERWQVRLGAFTGGRFPETKNGLEDTPFLTVGTKYRLISGLTISVSALSNIFFIKKINDKARQIERSQILFGMQWQME